MGDMILVGLIALVIGWGIGLFQGERIGTADTERRWSDAVGRADFARQTFRGGA
jgi:hypothetical protein